MLQLMFSVYAKKMEDLSKTAASRQADETIWSAPLQDEENAIFPVEAKLYFFVSFHP